MPNLWVVLSLICAFSLATSDALTKKALKDKNEYLVAWFRLFFSLPFLVLIWFFIPTPLIDEGFYRAFLTALPIEIITVVLYIKALKLSPLSLTLPFLSLTPLFLIFVSYFIVGEKVSLWGGIGILLIVSGSYLLNIKEAKKGLFKPFRIILKEKGSVLMIFVALLYSFTSSLGKVAIEHSSALFFAATYFTTLTLVFTPIALWKGRNDIKEFVHNRHYKHIVIPGLLYGLMIATHMIAMSLTKVAYMISVKRLSLLIGIIYGYYLFKEEGFSERLSGAILMFLGFVMVVTAA